jgi:hypothetical protein
MSPGVTADELMARLEEVNEQTGELDYRASSQPGPARRAR